MDIFIINLQDSKHRRNLMQHEIDKTLAINRAAIMPHNKDLCDFLAQNRCTLYKSSMFENHIFNFIFFNAIHISELENYKQYFGKLKFIKYAHRAMRSGEKACFLSHFKLWNVICAKSHTHTHNTFLGDKQNEILESNEIKKDDGYVILEDDVILKDNFLRTLVKISTHNFLYVRLMYLQKSAFRRLDIDDFFITDEFLSGAQGYYLNTHGAQMFISNCKDNIFKTLDGYIDEPFFHGIFSVGLKESAIDEEINESRKSDINKFNSADKYVFFTKIIHKIYKPLYKFQRKRFLKKYNLRDILLSFLRCDAESK